MNLNICIAWILELTTLLMTSYEYISILLSIIIGVGITHLLIGLGRLVNKPKTLKIYWIHIVWTFFIFHYMITFWWFEFKLGSVQEWTFQLYYFIILYAIILFCLCIINMPFHFPENFKQYYYSKRKWFFSVILAYNIVDIIDTLVKGSDHIINLGTGYLLLITVSILLSIVAIFSRKELVHGIIAITYALYHVLYTFIVFNALSGNL